jgi:hypothetical protein
MIVEFSHLDGRDNYCREGDHSEPGSLWVLPASTIVVGCWPSQLQKHDKKRRFKTPPQTGLLGQQPPTAKIVETANPERSDLGRYRQPQQV